MATWTEPKTDWVDGDYFNVDPDYLRIQGNILYLIQIGEAKFPLITVRVNPPSDYSVNDVPTPEFFNTIVTDIVELLSIVDSSATTILSDIQYEDNGTAWNAEVLNEIEYQTGYIKGVIEAA